MLLLGSRTLPCRRSTVYYRDYPPHPAVALVLPHIDLWFGVPPDDGVQGDGVSRRRRALLELHTHESVELPLPLDTAERALVARIRGETQDAQVAFEHIYREYAPALARFVYGYLRSRTASEDVIADVFLSVWARRAEWVPRYGIRAYLYAAARHRALNVRRSEMRAGQMLEREEAHLDEGDTGSSPHTQLELGERREQMTALLEALPEESRRLAELRWSQGLSAAEIAVVFGVNRAAIDNRLSRLVKRLQALAERAGKGPDKGKR